MTFDKQGLIGTISWKNLLVSQKTTLVLLISALLLTVLVFCFLKPIPQLQSYHHFADQRSWLGIPNAWNVLSNIAIALPGLWGLFLLTSSKVQFSDPRERWLWLGVSVGLILTAIGSSYYHLAPDNVRLVWDRLPMTFVFMSVVAALISERIKITLGLWLWPALIGIGFYSVLLWYGSELQGNSDLRFYIAIQVFTILVAMIMLLSPSPYNRNWDLAVVVMCYGLALFFDLSDHQIHRITRGLVSGHTLKHLAVGLAGVWLIRMIWKRKQVKYI